MEIIALITPIAMQVLHSNPYIMCIAHNINNDNNI